MDIAPPQPDRSNLREILVPDPRFPLPFAGASKQNHPLKSLTICHFTQFYVGLSEHMVIWSYGHMVCKVVQFVVVGKMIVSTCNKFKAEPNISVGFHIILQHISWYSQSLQLESVNINLSKELPTIK